MSSVIFQPLLHDPLGWKSSNSTYTDTFKWKSNRSTNKNKRISAYGQQYQRQLQKQQTNNYSPSTPDGEQTIQRVILVKKNDENRRATPVSNRSSPSKTPPAVLVSEEPPAFIIDYKQRPASSNREATCGSRASQRSLTAPTAAEETRRPATSLDARTSSKEEKEKVITDPNNDNSRHWLTYPNPKTPDYLIDIKKRLGQLKIPSTLARPISASNAAVEQPESSVSNHQRHQSVDQRHFLDFNLPDTPNEMRAARHRLERHRYNPSLDDYPLRPKTCPVRTTDTSSKSLTSPSIAPESEDEQLPQTQTTPTKDDVWIADEENKATDNEVSTIMVQMTDVDGLPNEYVQAVETAKVAQEEYLQNLKTNNEKRPDNPVYRLPSLSSDNQNESFIAYRNQQQSTPPTNINSTRRNEFGTWVRNATDKERESAMKILHDVLTQPIMGYDIPKKKQTVFKQPPAPPSIRTNSATRKLGRTRSTHRRIPCEICEKDLIKRHVWNLSRSNTLTCPHQAQGIKPPLIQVRA